MARVALVSHDVQAVRGRAGGVGAFVTHWARLLRNSGEEVTIILVHAEFETPGLDVRWAEKYRAWGIHFIEVHCDPPTPDRWPEAWAMRLSEKLHPALAHFDAVYFQDWANPAFHTLRVQRFSAKPGPVCVTVLHGPSNWVRLGNRSYPRIPDDLHLEFVERYSAEHSNFVIAPSRYILDWVKRDGMNFRTRPVVLGLPFFPPEVCKPIPEEPLKKRLVFFGRLETRKGFTLFTQALLELWNTDRESLSAIDEVVLLGHEDEPGSVRTVKGHLAKTGMNVVHIGDLDSEGAAHYLHKHAAGAIAVIASAWENFPYAVIEASLIPGLRLICSSGGGSPEVLTGSEDERLFDPNPRSLAAKLRKALVPAPGPPALPYDFAAANDAWLAFHQRILENRPVKDRMRHASVCVCIPYFNKGRFFPELLRCLENQTTGEFDLVAVDDGSSDAEAVQVFDAMARKYEPRGWKFLRQKNAFVDAARNSAAQQAESEYLLFIDADDLIPSHAIERMLEAVAISQVDCLVSASELFSDENLENPVARYMPIGANLVAGLIEPIIFGGPMILIRREAFEAIGGYRPVRGAAHEDWELQARLVMRGFDTDVLPEYLHRYRQLQDGLARTSDGFLAKRRIIDCYEEQFSKIGMQGIGGAMFALYRRCQELEGAVRDSVPLELRLRLHNRLAKMLGPAE